MSVVTLAIAVCILAVLVPIFIFMSKNAAAIMVLINDTDEDIRMIDLHATHGKIIGIFKEKAELDNPQPILPKRLPPIINPTTKKVMVEGSVQAGFFAARKRDNALVGSQGGMRFDATERYAIKQLLIICTKSHFLQLNRCFSDLPVPFCWKDLMKLFIKYLAPS